MLRPNTKYKWLIVLAPCVILIMMLALMQYLSYPTVESFELESINVWSILQGLHFALMFGLGLSSFNSIVTLITILIVVWVTIFYIIRRFVK